MFSQTLCILLAANAPSVLRPQAPVTWTDGAVLAGAATGVILMRGQQGPWSSLDWAGTETGKAYKEDFVPTWAIALAVGAASVGSAVEGGAQEAIAILQGTGLTLMVSDFAKHSLGRPRPDYDDRMRLYDGGGQDEKLKRDGALSMPSGHAAAATVLAWQTAFWWQRAACRRGTQASGSWLRFGAPLSLGAAVAISRVPNNRHNLSDVLVGSAIGSAVAFAVNRGQFGGGRCP
jgi:membrane-associated phospholipid phosphatase